MLRRGDDGAVIARTNFALNRTIASSSTELFAASKYLDQIVWTAAHCGSNPAASIS
ncbi:MAG TPA: hypothetical protein VJ770_07630 [Stellaceae bacterium]|nr:hypothetical protein [Stellaceae bacterium]